jgi:hypothetical protein
MTAERSISTVVIFITPVTFYDNGFHGGLTRARTQVARATHAKEIDQKSLIFLLLPTCSALRPYSYNAANKALPTTHE